MNAKVLYFLVLNFSGLGGIQEKYQGLKEFHLNITVEYSPTLKLIHWENRKKLTI